MPAKPPMRPFRDRRLAAVKAGHVLKATDGRLLVVVRRVAEARQAVRGLEDLEVVELVISPGSSACYQTARYARIVGTINLARVNRRPRRR